MPEVHNDVRDDGEILAEKTEPKESSLQYCFRRLSEDLANPETREAVLQTIRETNEKVRIMADRGDFDLKGIEELHSGHKMYRTPFNV